jgi:uncharacterized protein (TIGR03905 family)
VNQKARIFTYDAKGKGACCSQILISLRGETIQDVRFVGGCEGNHRGIETLVRGRTAPEVIRTLLGTPCQTKGTSCPDQLAKALQAAMQA